MNITISTLKSTYILVALSVGYAIVDKSVLHLTPILTVVLSYMLMREKGVKKDLENRKILNNIFLVNLISLLIGMSVTNHINDITTGITLNIMVCYIYHRITFILSKRRIMIIKNPNEVYSKFNEKIQKLENLYKETEKKLTSTSNEGEKEKLKIKLETIKYNLEESKRQLELIKRQVELRTKK